MASSAFGSFEVFHGESLPPSPNYHYIDAPIKAEVKKKIINALNALPVPQDNNISVLAQFWGATKTNSKIHLLTTTSLPFALSGNNQELQNYRRGCLRHKWYVYEDSKEGKRKAFGLPGIAFLNLTHEQTQNMHDYHEDERPPCEHAIFKRKWGSFVVPVFDVDRCVGVLEFVMDMPKDSYNDYIFIVYSALQHAGLYSSIQINSRKELEMFSGKKRDRKTKTSDVTKYSSLVPYMGLSKATTAEKLGLAGAAKKAIIESTFRNLRENVGIPEWPWIRNSTGKATSVLGTQMNGTVSETGSCLTPSADLTSFSGPETQTETNSFGTPFADLISIPGNGFSELSWEHPQPTNPGFMLECRELMEYQNNKYPPCFMNDVELINVDSISNIIRDEGNSVITSDIEASVSYGEMEYQVSITEEDTDAMDTHVNDMDSEEWINEYVHKYGV